MSPRGQRLVTIGALLFGFTAAGDVNAAGPGEARPRIGLALSGGGARGGAHVGVLKVLEELRVPVDYVAGTSVGAIVGGLYSSGMAPGDIEAALASVDWKTAFDDSPDRRRVSFRLKQDDDQALFPLELGVGKKGVSTKAGLVAGQKINFILRSMTLHTTGIERFDELRVPYRAVAADLDSGEAVVLDHGDLARAMRASMAIPAFFTPVEIDGRLLVDGGIARNLPVDVVREMGAERIIAIDVGTPPKGVEGELSAFGVASQALAVLYNRNVEEQLELLEEHDLLITPELSEVKTGDFGDILAAVAAGEAAARGAAARLAQLSIAATEYAAYLERQRRVRGGRLPAVRVDDVELRGPAGSAPGPAGFSGDA